MTRIPRWARNRVSEALPNTDPQPMKLIAIYLAVVCAVSALGCTSLSKSLPQPDSGTGRGVDTAVEQSTSEELQISADEQKIGLLQANAQLAELDNLPDNAIQSYERIISIDPNNVTAHHRLALVHFQKGDYDDADERFQAALRLAENNASIHNDYGYFCHLQDRSEDAIEHLERAVELNPDDSAAHNNLGLVLACENRLDEAQNQFRQGNCSRAEILNNLALARAVKSDLEAAAKLYRQALHIDPNQETAQKSLESINRVLDERPSLIAGLDQTGDSIMHVDFTERAD